MNSASARAISRSPGQIDRQQVHREQGQQQRDRTHNARRHHSRMRELGIESDHTHQQQNEEHIGLDDACEEALPSRHVDVDDLMMGEREAHGSSVETRDRPAIKLPKEILGRARDQVAEFAVDRFLRGERFRVGNRGFRQFHISPALDGVAAQVRLRVVEDLVLHRLVERDWVSPNSGNR